MSDWLVHLVQIGGFGKHPNADTLSITQVYGQNVIFRTGTYENGDLAVFLPPDTVLPTDPEHPILKDNPGLKPGRRIDAVRLRGIFSNGLLVPAKILFTEEELASIPVGTHVAERLGLTKYEDQGDRLATTGENERDPGFMPVYTDIDGWAKYRNAGLINEGDEVVILEKIHGANGRFCYRDGRLWVGSRTCVKAEYVDQDGVERNLWWQVAKNLGMEERFKRLLSGAFKFDDINLEGTVIYGEVYGQVQDLRYGVDKGATFRVFDSWNPSLGRYNDWNVTEAIALAMGLDVVPELYRGPWEPSLESLRNGPSVLYPGHTREGYVIKPLQERWNSKTQRTIFKAVGEDYKLRKRKG
jgi:RNA ligase (TIGR02306 family)